MTVLDALIPFASEASAETARRLVKSQGFWRKNRAIIKSILQDALRKGVSFPQARQTALTQYFDMPSTDPDRISSVNAKTVAAILSQPNNILGIEYMKALYKRNSSMKAYSIKRIGAGYHESELTESYSSASAIRRALIQDSLSESIYRQLPSAAQSIMKEAFGTRYPVYANDFSLLLKYKLLQETKETLTNYMDISEDLANLNHKSLK